MNFAVEKPMPRLKLRPGLWIVIGALGASLSLPAAAQWKWRDKSGVVQYSDLPPPIGVPDADILQRPAPNAPRRAASVPTPAASAPLLVPKTGDSELDAKRRKTEQDETARKKVDDERVAQEKLDNCSRAKAQAKALDDGQRMSRINAKGEREFLDDKGRAEESQRARNVIASDCK
ncbi:MAG: DUF4124 domain-containing protein [Burkholderiales bacterium]